MKYILTLFIISFTFSQSFTVENVQAGQSTDGEHILTVSFDLVSDGTFPSFMVHPEISIDGGETWDYIIMPPIEENSFALLVWCSTAAKTIAKNNNIDHSNRTLFLMSGEDRSKKNDFIQRN